MTRAFPSSATDAALIGCPLQMNHEWVLDSMLHAFNGGIEAPITRGSGKDEGSTSGGGSTATCAEPLSGSGKSSLLSSSDMAAQLELSDDGSEASAEAAAAARDGQQQALGQQPQQQEHEVSCAVLREAACAGLQELLLAGHANGCAYCLHFATHPCYSPKPLTLTPTSSHPLHPPCIRR